MLKIGVTGVHPRKQKQRRCEGEHRRSQRSLSRRRANHDQDGRNDRAKNYEQNHCDLKRRRRYMGGRTDNEIRMTNALLRRATSSGLVLLIWFVIHH